MLQIMRKGTGDVSHRTAHVQEDTDGLLKYLESILQCVCVQGAGPRPLHGSQRAEDLGSLTRECSFINEWINQ